jgi:polar amino acid transport system substrate-binding protein
MSTTTETALRKAISEGAYQTTVVAFPTHADALEALESRQIDAYLADRVLLVDLLGKAHDPSQLFVASKLFTREAYGIALRRGDADLRLLVDHALSKFYRTDAFANLLSSYFGSEAPAMRTEILAQSIPE